MKKFIALTLAITVVAVAILYLVIAFGVRYAIHKVASASPLIPVTSSYRRRDVPYCKPNGATQSLDLYLPNDGHRLYPLIVYVHGGSWVSGSKDTEVLERYLPALSDTGYAVAAINYRLAPTYTFPSQADDVKCAIRFLRAHAVEYNIDSLHIGIIGESAGGYLAAFCGVTGDNKSFKSNEYSYESDSAQAVVDIAGPVDFTVKNTNLKAASIVKTFLGSASPATASVLPYINEHTPPFLIMHGANDTIVPPDQSIRLQKQLAANRVASQLVIADNTGHSLNALSIAPQASQLAITMLKFLNANLH